MVLFANKPDSICHKILSGMLERLMYDCLFRPAQTNRRNP